MQGFEITIDGVAQPGNLATQADADVAANTARQANPGKTVAVRAKAQPPQR